MSPLDSATGKPFITLSVIDLIKYLTKECTIDLTTAAKWDMLFETRLHHAKTFVLLFNV